MLLYKKYTCQHTFIDSFILSFTHSFAHFITKSSVSSSKDIIFILIVCIYSARKINNHKQYENELKNNKQAIRALIETHTAGYNDYTELWIMMGIKYTNQCKPMTIKIENKK